MIGRVLGKVREESIAYFQGVAGHLARDPLKTGGAQYYTVRLISLLVFWLRRVRPLSSRVSLAESPLFYVGSLNQLKAVNSLIDSFSCSGKVVYLVAHPSVLGAASLLRKPRVIVLPLKLGLGGFFYGLLLLLVRAPRLILLKRNQYPKMLVDRVQAVYFFLLSFNSYFKRSCPQVVIVANDHNADCNCLILLGQVHGVKTVYVQHAQINSNFPRLFAEYNFLYGRKSLEAYASAMLGVVEGGRRRAYLMGPIETSDAIDSARDWVGVAVNNLTNFDRLEKVLLDIFSSGNKVLLRYHSRQFPHFKVRVADRFAESIGAGDLAVSIDTVERYAASLKWAIAGLSSIHLDLVQRGVPSFFADIDDLPEDTDRDYYGFLASGLIGEYSNFNIDFVREPAKASVRQYSASYCSLWKNEIPDLAMRIIDGGQAPLIEIDSGDEKLQVFELSG